MPRKVRNVAASIRARLLARARGEKADYQILLTRYALERLLYRLSVSAYRDRFILKNALKAHCDKGALLFVTWLDDPFRPTRDLDLLGHGADDAETMKNTFHAICSTQVLEDGVIFDVEGLAAAPIREDLKYGGVRVQTYAIIDGARIPIQVDVGFGDVITPGPIEIAYPVLLDSPAPHLRAYPVETVVAEKFNAIVVLGIANSRLRCADVPTGLTRLYAEEWDARWKAFLTREHMSAVPGDLGQVLEDLRTFLVPLMAPLNTDSYWPSGGPWSFRTHP